MLARWSDADKCLLLSLFTLAFIAAWSLRLLAAHRDPQVAAYVDRAFLPWMLAYEGVQAVGFTLLAGAALVLRRSPKPHPWLMHLTLQLWYVSQAFALYAIGPYTSPFALISLLFTAVCMTVHELRPILVGLATLTVLLVGSTVLERLGFIPYAPLFGNPAMRPATGWLLSIGGASLLASALLLFIFGHVAADWRERERELRELSTTDELTRLSNRRHFIQAAPPQLEAALRGGPPLSVVLVDVDHFKRINDEYGHHVGDQVLVSVAAALRQEARAQDVVARFGGEEFALLLPDTDAEAARALAERCRASIDGLSNVLDGHIVKVTVSLGVATAPHPAVARVEHLLRLADEALYRAKAAGRNRVQLAA
jgi:diguanylate cyclase (GGDEF)-like protein